MRPRRTVPVLFLVLIASSLLGTPSQAASDAPTHPSSSAPDRRPAWRADSDSRKANFGSSVGTAGDVNGDGFDDVIVGATRYHNGQRDEGGAFAYHGSASGLATAPAWTAESDQESAQSGVSVGTAGDVNGDGFDDVIVGAWLYENGDFNEGRAFAYHGSASGLSLIPAWTAEGDHGYGALGRSVAAAGDVNGDGFDDVIVGAPGFDTRENNEGRAFAYHGSASGLSLTRNWTAQANQAWAYLGTSVGTAGDVNGDGFDDVIVGANRAGFQNEGMAFVYHGSASGLSFTSAWTAEGNQPGANFGYSVGTAGDVNGDGFDDVIVGAFTADNDLQFNEGWAFVYHGSASGLSFTAAWMGEGDQVSALFGLSVGTAGDMNGDGFDDVIVGAPGYDNEGRAFAYRGSASGLSTTASWADQSDQIGAGYGNSVGMAGDVNGDGFDDVIVGASAYDQGQIDEGAAFAYGRRSRL